MKTRRLLIEMGCEELPHSQVVEASRQLTAALKAEMHRHRLIFGESKSYFTPRRLSWVFEEVQEAVVGQEETRLGPTRDGALDDKGNPRPAALGFARACGVDFSELTWVETVKGERLAHVYRQSDQPIQAILPAIMESALSSLQGVRLMRWGAGSTYSFLRPVRWLCALWGETIMPLSCMGCESDRITQGHRVHCPEPIALACAEDYERVLGEAFVVVDPEERRRRLLQQLDTYDDGQINVCRSDALCDEIVACVEWPITHMGSFDDKFLVLPESLLSSVLHKHQKCFHCIDSHGQVINRFVMVANLASDQPGSVIRGNERVVAARLNDALFFYTQDKEEGIASFAERLVSVDWFDALGNMAAKTERLAELAVKLAKEMDCDPEAITQAARYAKADMVSQVVQELPEMEGEWGAYLAREAGMAADVAQIIQEALYPRHAGDRLPNSRPALCLAIADRLDTLVGGFLIGAWPTADKDPFALRRHALSLIRLLLSADLAIDWMEWFRVAVQGYKVPPSPEYLEKRAWNFMQERLRSHGLERGLSSRVVQALSTVEDRRIVAIDRRLQAVQAFLAEPASEAVMASCKRIWQMVKSEARDEPVEVDASLLAVAEEVALYEAAQVCAAQMAQAMAMQQFDQALMALVPLSPAVDAFFDHIMVQCEDAVLRRNRMALLRYLLSSYEQVISLVAVAGL